MLTGHISSPLTPRGFIGLKSSRKIWLVPFLFAIFFGQFFGQIFTKFNYFFKKFQFFTIFKCNNFFQRSPSLALYRAKKTSEDAVKLMVVCKAPYNFINMTPRERELVLTSGPARFQRLSAYHPSITSRYVENLVLHYPHLIPEIYLLICVIWKYFWLM